MRDLGAADMAEAEAKQLSPGYQAALSIYWRHIRDYFGSEATLADVTYDSVRAYEGARRKMPMYGKPGASGQTIRSEVAGIANESRTCSPCG